jgi:glycosyltransferase involved in cell wall biosynthesis
MPQNSPAARPLVTAEFDAVRKIVPYREPIETSPSGTLTNYIKKNLILDVSDLVFYIGHHANLTGIQRVQACLILGLFRLSSKPSITCVSWDRVNARFLKLDTSYFVTLLKDLTRPKTDRVQQFDIMAARNGILPQGQVFHSLPDDGGQNTFLLLGAAWVNKDYFYQICNLKRKLSAKFVCVIHDLIPIYARETCDQGTAEVFRMFLEQAYRLADLFICVSDNTRKDLERFACSEGFQPPVTRVVTHATEFRDAADIVEFQRCEFHPTRSNFPEQFVLFVSTIEGRKNHRLAFNIWRKLLSSYGDSIPVLVCVGRFGWRSEDFIRDVIATNNLSGKIVIMSDVSDEELDGLYDKCLFTIYPSLYEGWGLPISESLGKGKLCVCSNTSSMPEAGGEFALYIDPADPAAAFETIKDLIEDRSRVAALNLRIRQGFKPKSWTQTAAEYIHALADLSPKPGISQYVEIISGREYLLREVPRGFGSYLGDELFWHIKSAFTGPLSRAGVSVDQFFDGQELRGRGAWKEPEPWGTWLGVDGGILEFVWPEKEAASLLCAIEYRILPIFASKEVIYTIGSKTTRLPATFNGEKPATHFLRCEVFPGYNSIMINMALTSEDRDNATRTDARSPMFGFSSVIFVDQRNLEDRLDLYETLLSRRGLL